MVADVYKSRKFILTIPPLFLSILLNLLCIENVLAASRIKTLEVGKHIDVVKDLTVVNLR